MQSEEDYRINCTGNLIVQTVVATILADHLRLTLNVDVNPRDPIYKITTHMLEGRYLRGQKFYDPKSATSPPSSFSLNKA